MAKRVLISHGDKIDAYHGGTLVGGAIIDFLKKVDVIMDKITELAIEQIHDRMNNKTPLMPVPEAEFVALLDRHRDLFHMQNVAYGGMRLHSPSQQAPDEAVKEIAAMENLWLDLGFSLTPKVHLVFCHAHDEMVRFNGLGDKTEDFIKKNTRIRSFLTVCFFG